LHTTSPIKSTDITLAKKTFEVFQTPKKPRSRYHYVAYIGVSRNLPSGKYTLRLNIQLKNNQRHKSSHTITVVHPKTKKKGKVKLNKRKQALSRDTSSLKKEARIIGQKFRTRTPLAYFEGPFIKPAKGRISSDFGKERLYNSGIRRRHAGTDIANKIGTPVKAPNHGRVILSTLFKVHGNTVMIDHGFGIVTIYNHLNERFVSEGQLIRKGDIIGRIGDTGLTSGPHLHWGLSLQNVRVDAMKWTKR
jgi:murein DD-endopeptidase MepM/ murein hydrolase activator NlpD